LGAIRIRIREIRLAEQKQIDEAAIAHLLRAVISLRSRGRPDKTPYESCSEAEPAHVSTPAASRVIFSLPQRARSA
jgi:hypothetical protein